MAVLNQQDLDQIRPYLDECTYAPGELILDQGQVMGRFHIIVDGTADVYIQGERKVRVATLGPGHFVGEMSTLTGDPTVASVEAAEPVVTLSVDRDGLVKLIGISEALRSRVLNGLIDRIKNTNTRVQEENLRSAIMANQIARQRSERFGELLGQSPLMEQLREQVRRLAQTSDTVVVLGEPGTGKQHVAARLHYEGPRQVHPLLTVDARTFTLDEWRRQSLAAEDGTLVLLHADEIEPELLSQALSSLKRVRVVLTAKDLKSWPGLQPIQLPPLRERSIDIPDLLRNFLRDSGVHNAQEALAGDALRYLVAYPYLSGNVKELEKALSEAVVMASGETIKIEHLRLGSYRPPSSRPRVGLALGSGAVRGAAHVGVMRVLEEAGIPIDLIAGSSAGAMAGGLYAAGVSIDRLDDLLCKLKFGEMFRWVMPRFAFWDNVPVVHTLERHMGGPLTFADLKIPFMAVACDVLTGHSVVLNSGRVSTAIQASTAIPMMVKPVHREGRVLADGGVVHNVPAMAVRSAGADLVIAVSVSVPGYTGGPPSNLFESLMNAFDITSEHLSVSELEWADVVIRPDFQGLNQNLKHAPTFIKKGEEAARKALPAIQQRLKQLIERQA